MVQSNELRIGNWVKITLGVTDELQDGPGYIYRQIDVPDFYKNDFLDPIPLSAEILEKCGFKKWGRDDMPRTISFEHPNMHIFPANSFCDFVGYGFTHYKLSSTIDETNKGIIESARFKFQYLHQLQNLYFALTGEELPVELCNIA